MTEPRVRLRRAYDDAGATDGTRVLMSGTVTSAESDGPFHGPVDQWIDELSAFALDHRFDTFVFWNEDSSLDRFAQEVVPAMRSS